jgi:hypothetical protein
MGERIRGRGLRKKTAHRKPGRPTTLTPKVEKAFLRLVTEGILPGEACRKVGISYSTLVRKEIDNEHFERVLARAYGAGARRRLELAEISIDKARTHEQIGRAREKAIHARWVASKWIPVYSDRVGILAGTGRSDDREDVSDLEIARRLAYQLRLGELELERLELPQLAKLMKLEKLLIQQGMTPPRPHGWEGPWPPSPPPPLALPAPGDDER